MAKFKITEPQKWVIEGVNYRGKIQTISFLDGLLDNGAQRTQDEWAGHSGFPSFPLLHASFTALFRNRNGEYRESVEKLRARINELAYENYLVTSTRIVYKPSGLDEVIHDYKTQFQASTEVPFVGPERIIINSRDKKVCRALLGTGDIDEIKKVYKWLLRKVPAILRLDKSPEEEIEAVARFGADSTGADMDCYRGPTGSYSSLEVFASAKAASEIAKMLKPKKRLK